MPKTKTRRAATKRFKVTGAGRILRRPTMRAHKLGKKSSKQKRKFGRDVPVTHADEKALKQYAEKWGTLPAAERQKLVQEITRDMPAKYKPMIEQYFKSLNQIHGYEK